MTPTWQADSLPPNDLGSPTEGEEEKKILYFPLGVMLEPQSCDDHFVILTKKKAKRIKESPTQGVDLLRNCQPRTPY